MTPAVWGTGLATLVGSQGYWLLALGCLLEGETVLVLAGFAAHRGYLDLPWVIAIGAASGFVGDQCYFWLGRRYGPALLARFPSLAARAGQVQRLIHRYDAWLVIGMRFAYGLRVAGPVLIGASALSPWRFALFNALGASAWAGIVAGLGWGVGHALQAVLGDLRHYEAVVMAVVLAIGVSYAVFRRRRGNGR